MINMVDRVQRPVRIAIAALAVYWVALFVMTHVPVQVRLPGSNWDKVAHLIAYAGLGFLLACVFGRCDRSKVRLCAIVLGLSVFYGAADELIQMLVPGRTADWMDWVADIAGSTIGLVLFFTVSSLRRTAAPAEAKTST